MKVQLVTHSIIPNLNSGLVPIDPVGLVDDILIEHGVLPHVLPIAVHLKFWVDKCRGLFRDTFTL